MVSHHLRELGPFAFGFAKWKLVIATDQAGALIENRFETFGRLSRGSGVRFNHSTLPILLRLSTEKSTWRASVSPLSRHL